MRQVGSLTPAIGRKINPYEHRCETHLHHKPACGRHEPQLRSAPRWGRLLPRRVRMNLNEPPGSVFWPMTLRPVQLYVHSRETYATRRYQEVTHRKRYRMDESCPSSSPTARRPRALVGMKISRRDFL